MIASDNKAFQSVTFQTSTWFCNCITCFCLFAYIFVTVTVCKYMGAVNWCPSVSFHIWHQVSPWCKSRQSEKKKRFYSGTQQTEASLQKARKSVDSWVWRSSGRYFLINHCIILFEIMLISKNKFNTVHFFYSFAEHSSCDRVPWWMQASVR